MGLPVNHLSISQLLHPPRPFNPIVGPDHAQARPGMQPSRNPLAARDSHRPQGSPCPQTLRHGSLSFMQHHLLAVPLLLPLPLPLPVPVPPEYISNDSEKKRPRPGFFSQG